MNSKRVGRRTVALAQPPSVLSFANIGGKFEKQGPLATDGLGPYITHVTCGKIVDFGITDANNMGAAMAPVSVKLTPCCKTFWYAAWLSTYRLYRRGGRYIRHFPDERTLLSPKVMCTRQLLYGVFWFDRSTEYACFLGNKLIK